MAKIFITGGMGYLGSHLAREAVKAGHDVMLYDSLIYEQNMTKMLEEIGTQNLIVGDTRNLDYLIKSINLFEPDYVVHFAEFASVYAADHNPRLTEENNFYATMFLLGHCERKGIKVIWNSSSSVYGTQKGDKLMTETDPIPTPTDNYVKNKLRVEEYISHHPDLQIITFRPATVFGIAPRLRIDLLSNHFTYMAIAKGDIKIYDGNAYRACIDINVLTQAYLKVIAKGEWKQQLYNIGQHNMTKQSYAIGVQSVVPCKLDASSDISDPRNLRIDSSRFYDEFDFRPTLSYEESIQDVAVWINEHLDEIEANKFIGILTMPYSEWQRMCS